MAASWRPRPGARPPCPDGGRDRARRTRPTPGCRWRSPSPCASCARARAASSSSCCASRSASPRSRRSARSPPPSMKAWRARAARSSAATSPSSACMSRPTPRSALALEALGTVSESASLRAMARNMDGKSALVEVKAVDAAYPLYGTAAIAEPEGAGAVWHEPGKVVVERTLLDRLGVAHRRYAHHRRGQAHHRRNSRPAAGPPRRPAGLWTESADVARHAHPHRPRAAGEPDPLDLPAEASGRRGPGQARADRGAERDQRRLPRKRLRHSRLDRPRAVDPPRRAALHPIHLLRRADGALARRHRRRQRHRQLHGEEARRDRHLQMPRRLEPPRAQSLSAPGLHARRSRHRARARHRRAHARRSLPRAMPTSCPFRSPSSPMPARCSRPRSPASSPCCSSCCGPWAARAAFPPR